MGLILKGENMSTSNHMSDKAKTDIAKLVKKYDSLSQAERAKYTEADTGTKFILPLLRALGWDIESANEVKEQQRELNKPADIVLVTNGIPRIVVELKQLSVSLDGSYTQGGKKTYFADQAIRYAWNRRIDWAILTNFREIRLYDARSPTHAEGLVFRITVNEILNRLNDLEYLTRGAVYGGRLDALENKKNRMRVDEEVLTDLIHMRKTFSECIASTVDGIGYNTNEIRLMVQTLIDRLIVIRVAEDRSLFEQDTLKTIHAGWRKRGGKTSFVRWMRALFGEFEEIYNTTLFRGGEVDKAVITNEAITEAVERLYKYDFSLIDSDILGNIYENYLTTTLMDTETGVVQIIDSSAERKKLGTYYTPRHMVAHILDKTLRKKLDGCKTPDDVSQIKVLDPACGSGSFLIKAFDLFMSWYNEYNEMQRTTKVTSEQNSAVKTNFKTKKQVSTLDNTLNVVTDPEKRILRDNLFGIDVDPQAASIASVNLMLKAIRPNDRLDNILGTNIIVGNALVTGLEDGFAKLSDKHREELRPLDIVACFGKTKFDVVVGNPPYFKIRKENPVHVSENFKAVQTKAVNIAMVFIHRAAELLAPNGNIGLVIPKMCAYAKAWSGARSVMFDQTELVEVVDCMEAFSNVKLEQIIVIATKGKSGFDDCRISRAESDRIVQGHSIDRQIFKEKNMIYLESATLSWDIAARMRSNGTTLNDLLGRDNLVAGEGIQSMTTWLSKKPVGKTGKRILKGANLQRFRITPTHFYRKSNRRMINAETDSVRRMYKPHIVCQRIVIHNTKPQNHLVLTFAFDHEGSRSMNTVTSIIPNSRMDTYALLAILNSRAISWYAHKFIYANAVRSMDLTPGYLEKIVVPKIARKDEYRLKTLGQKLERLAYEPAASKPKLDDYLTCKTYGTVELRRHYDSAKHTNKKIIDRKTVGIVKKVKATICGESVIEVTVDYTPHNTQTIITDKRIIQLKIEHRGVRDYVVKMITKGSQTTRSRIDSTVAPPPLLMQVMNIRLTAYGSSYNQHLKTLIKMLDPYINDITAFEKWQEEFMDVDAAVDKIVYDAFELDQQSVDHIQRHSRPPEWSNY